MINNYIAICTIMTGSLGCLLQYHTFSKEFFGSWLSLIVEINESMYICMYLFIVIIISISYLFRYIVCVVIVKY